MKWALKVTLAFSLCMAAVPWSSLQQANAATETEQAEQSSNVFIEDKVVDVKITIDSDDFQDILDNAADEKYYGATVDYNGKVLNNVGIRAKGNLSLRSVVQMDDSDRYSFKLSFDQYISGQNLYGLDKINLNNGYSDASYMREFLAYELSEMLGLPTPKHSFVRVYVNGEYKGLYLAVEQVDESFIDSHYTDTTGTLYKGIMTGSGSDLQWIDDDADSYTGLEVKTDKQDKDALINMLDKLNNDATTPYTDYLDVDSILEYLTLNVVTNNTDSYIGQNKQNYYLYEHGGIFSMIPWDYNMAFGGLGGGGGMGGGGGFPGGDADDRTDNGADNTNAQTNTNGQNAADTNNAANTTNNTQSTGNAATNGNTAAADTTAQQKTDNTAAGNTTDAAKTNNATNNTNTANNNTTATNGDNANTTNDANTNAANGDNANAANGNNAAEGDNGGGSSSSLMIDEPTSGALAERPLVAKLLAVDEYKAKYHEMIQTSIDKFLNNDTFTAKVKEIQTMIAADVKADPTSFYTYDEFESGVQSLIDYNKTNIENLQGQLDGTIASSGDGSGSGGGMGGGGGQGGGPGGQGGDQQNGGGMQPPSGMGGGPGGGGQGGGPGGDMGGFGGGQPTVNSSSQAMYTAISIGVLVLAMGFVLIFRRKRI
ncbi:CotH kinase family protein [Paenibacillus sp. WLX2291]|uniref:CotH kinase family protein n=1 Tax=Paenibacillus sp. WLX2291 TaxID=3296934 RepID=UPI003984604D